MIFLSYLLTGTVVTGNSISETMKLFIFAAVVAVCAAGQIKPGTPIKNCKAQSLECPGRRHPIIIFIHDK